MLNPFSVLYIHYIYIHTGPGYDLKLHPGVPLSKYSTLLAPLTRVTVTLLAAGQWILQWAFSVQLILWLF